MQRHGLCNVHVGMHVMLFSLRKFQLCVNVVAPGKLQVGLKISGQSHAGSHFNSVMLNYAGDAGNAGDGFTQDVAAAYPLIWSGGRRN